MPNLISVKTNEQKPLNFTITSLSNKVNVSVNEAQSSLVKLSIINHNNVVAVNFKESYASALASHNSSEQSHSDLRSKLDEQKENIEVLQLEKAEKTEIPTKLSQLENDSEFVAEDVFITTLEQKQNKEDELLKTQSKEIVGAINELSEQREELLDGLLTRASIDCDNISKQGKERIIDFFMPDYTRVVTYTPATNGSVPPPCDGWLVGHVHKYTSDFEAYVDVNGVRISRELTSYANIQYPVFTTDVITGSFQSVKLHIIPFKGGI